MVKGYVLMKLDLKSIISLENKLHEIPLVSSFKVLSYDGSSYKAKLLLKDGQSLFIKVIYLEHAYPSIINQLSEEDKDEEYLIIASPYVSPRSAELCKKAKISYIDNSGNCLFIASSIYLFEKGNANKEPEKRILSSPFSKDSRVSSLILRTMFIDPYKNCKLKHLSEQIPCSLGQVSKVMNYLVKNAYAVKEKDGYRLSDIEGLLSSWAEVYGKKEPMTYRCYSLDKIGVLEEKIKGLEKEGIEAYLTGPSGANRYAPNLRYNKVHVYIAPENISKAIAILGLKAVSEGSNVVIISMDSDAYQVDKRTVNGFKVVSPVQIYLDCMQIAGRGEESALTVMKKEIIKC